MSSGRRQENKQKRKAEIVDAAVRLLASGGPDALTMRKLASEAGVSEATPYNLFGSKAGILTAVFEQHLAESDPGRRRQTSAEDPLERLLDSPHLVAASWAAGAGWFRAFLESARDSGADLTPLTVGPGPLLRRDLAEAADAGLIGSEITTEVLVRQILFTNRGIYELWVEGTIDDDQLVDALTVGLVTAVLGVAAGELRVRLLDQLATIAEKESWHGP